MVLVWIVLGIRLVFLQKLDENRLSRFVNQQSEFEEILPARPGDLLDRNGRLLASTITLPSLWMDPSVIDDPRTVSIRIAAALNLDADQLTHRLIEKNTKRFIWIKRRISEEEVYAIQALTLPENCYGFRNEYQRVYPQGSIAAHILGLRDIDGIGRGGMEQALELAIRGREGKRIQIRDAKGRTVDVRQEPDHQAQHGHDVALTIDTVLQLYTENELDFLMDQWRPLSACAIVLQPQSGEVLALASRPAYDPNRPDNVSEAAWKNTAIASMYEPGSTLKPIIVSWGLEQKKIDIDKSIYCEQGSYRMGNRILHDHHPYGTLSLEDVLVKSSNVGMAKIGERMENGTLHEGLKRFGFGRKTGIELVGELNGLLHPLPLWTDYSTGSIPMGQEIAVTPMQLITAYSVLCDQGKLIRPHLVKKVLPNLHSEKDFNSPDSDSAYGNSSIVTRIISPAIADWIIQNPLKGVVERGTGKHAYLYNYTIFGKTGTAQKLDATSGLYSSQDHVLSFICGGPTQRPQALVLVLLDSPSIGESHFGGTVAAPAASRILEKTLRHLGVPSQSLVKRPAIQQ